MGELLFPPSFEANLQAELTERLSLWKVEVGNLLPRFPKDVAVEFDSHYIVPGSGTGGAAWDAKVIKLGYDPTFSFDQNQLLDELREAYFHEGYHLARGFSFATAPADLSAVDVAIEEGAATKFEMLKAGSSPGYGQYEDRTTMLAWIEELRSLPDGFDYDWQKYKFFDPENGRRWMQYKVGAFIVDEALHNGPELTIESLVELSCDRILALSKLA